ncbi:hypothetical protein ACJD0Z_06390 [Flavobacteriaceae bacterium M23B6Z8]
MESVFMNVFSKFFPTETCQRHWIDLQNAYTASGRYYHNLKHLKFIFEQLKPLKKKIEDWEVVLFTLFFHDYVYKVTRKDNELRSAVKAERVLRATSINESRINRCYEQIIATKDHLLCNDQDANYFNDADLAILGSDPESYDIYAQQIRKEYGIYPDFLYIPGRKKVIKHFLTMDAIFKTHYFRKKYEAIAIKNLTRELESIS